MAAKHGNRDLDEAYDEAYEEAYEDREIALAEEWYEKERSSIIDACCDLLIAPADDDASIDIDDYILDGLKSELDRAWAAVELATEHVKNVRRLYRRAQDYYNRQDYFNR